MLPLADEVKRFDNHTVFAVLDSVLAREDLDTVLEAAAFDRHAESQGKVVDVDVALGGEQRRLGEDPKMATTTRLFERGIDAILPQLLSVHPRF
jgi:hypothetical protein